MPGPSPTPRPSHADHAAPAAQPSQADHAVTAPRPSRTHTGSATLRRLVASIVVSVASLAWLAPAVGAGGHPPEFELEAVYIGCVDDEVDEPGVDGDALVRFRVYSNSAEVAGIVDGSWQVVADGGELASGGFVVPAAISSGATWEQVVRIPGDTGAASFEATVTTNSLSGTNDWVLAPSIEVPGDCPQPEETTTTSQPIEPEPAEAAAEVSDRVGDLVVATPRFTG